MMGRGIGLGIFEFGNIPEKVLRSNYRYTTILTLRLLFADNREWRLKDHHGSDATTKRGV